MRRSFFLILLALLLLISPEGFDAAVGTAVAASANPSKLTATVSSRQAAPLLQISAGKGTQYSRKLHGRKTANGERYNELAFTAAHRFLPFNTVVRVTNLNNGRDVVVRINDRGPFGKGRIVDVSHESAKRLNTLRAGVFNVQLEVIADKTGKIIHPGTGFYLSLAPAASPEKASAVLNSLRGGLSSKVRTAIPPLRVVKEAWNQRSTTYFVGLGPFASFKEAHKAYEKVRSKAPRATIRCIPLENTGSTSR